jgi:hypothetical protein
LKDGPEQTKPETEELKVKVSVQLVKELAGSATEEITVSVVLINSGAGLILYVELLLA